MPTFTANLPQPKRKRRARTAVVPSAQRLQKQLEERIDCLKRFGTGGDRVEDPLRFGASPAPSGPSQYPEYPRPSKRALEEPGTDSSSPKKKRRITPNEAAEGLYLSWNTTLPTLLDPYLEYTNRTSAKEAKPPVGEKLERICCNPMKCKGKYKSAKIKCLFFDHFKDMSVNGCLCLTIPQNLVQHGLFPTAPSQPRMAISIDLLGFYYALFERSCDAVHAFSAALHAFYSRHGFQVLNDGGGAIRDPFRRSLGNAIQWYDRLRISVDEKVEKAISSASLHSSHVETLRSRPEENMSNSPQIAEYVTAAAKRLSLSQLDVDDKAEKAITSAFMHSLPTVKEPQRQVKEAISSGPQITEISAASARNSSLRHLAEKSPEDSTSAGKQTAASPIESKAYDLDDSLNRPSRNRCARILQQRCPACFGGTSFGKSFKEGGDFHFATDATFAHSHRKSAGDSPSFYNPKYFISKAQVDAVGDRIALLRAGPARKYTRKVPDEAVDGCTKSFDAARGQNETARGEHFDDTGIMALICRHDIPLFLANIDTPGEQQKYAIALVEHIFQFLPPHATAALLYDVVCVLDRSQQRYQLLPKDIAERLIYALTAMHAYGHQWACQIVYNPRIRSGLGLSEGEGCERLWAKLRLLIGIVRSSGRSKRIWLLDLQARAIGKETRSGLGDWIRRRLVKGVQEQGREAEITLQECGISEEELEIHWEKQQTTQLSSHTHAPARLQKELEKIINLQNEMATVLDAIQDAKLLIEDMGSCCEESRSTIDSLERNYERLQSTSDGLYNSLNIPDIFPELDGIDLEFIRTLVMARDLKNIIRNRAIAGFFERDKVDQAVGGRQKPLGQRLFQQTKKGTARRAGALVSAIHKFNIYCVKLESLNQSHWNIPLPQQLPVELTALKSCQDMMEDVWMTRAEGGVPRWLSDSRVRLGIRAMLKKARCREERKRLGDESDNICRWFGAELSAIEIALLDKSNDSINVHLRRRKLHLISLKPRWCNSLASTMRFDSHIEQAKQIEKQQTARPPNEVYWVIPITALAKDSESSDSPYDDFYADSEDATMVNYTL